MTKIAIVGFGFMGRMHYGNWKKIRGAKVVAICDANLAQLTTVTGGNIAGSDATTDFTGVDIYDDFAKMLAAGGFDVVDVTLPTPLHPDMTVAALRAGYHVLCEKPMALKVRDCDRMLKAAEASGKTLLIAQCLRFWPEYVALRKLLLSGRYGRVVAADFFRASCAPDPKGAHGWFLAEKKSGGCLLDLHIHDADMIAWLFGKPKCVSAWTHFRADGRTRLFPPPSHGPPPGRSASRPRFASRSRTRPSFSTPSAPIRLWSIRRQASPLPRRCRRWGPTRPSSATFSTCWPEGPIRPSSRRATPVTRSRFSRRLNAAWRKPVWISETE